MFPALRTDAPAASTLAARLRDTAAFVRRVRDLGVAEPRRTIPRQLFPHRIEENYASSLLGIVAASRETASHLIAELPRLLDTAGRARDHIDSLRRTDVGEAKRAHDLIQAARDRMRFATQRTVTLPLIASVARRANAHQREQFARQVKAALGVDLWTPRSVDIRTDAASSRGVRLDAAAHTVDAFIAHNVSLIKSLGDQPLDEVEGLVARAFSIGTRHETLAKEIERRFDVARSSARLIARDQLGKLNGQLAADRQKEIGVKRWEWQTVGDGAVRKTHAALEDNVYSYSGDPQPPFMPGEEVNCRCSPRPIFEEILQAIDSGEDLTPLNSDVPFDGGDGGGDGGDGGDQG